MLHHMYHKCQIYDRFLHRELKFDFIIIMSECKIFLAHAKYHAWLRVKHYNWHSSSHHIKLPILLSLCDTLLHSKQSSSEAYQIQRPMFPSRWKANKKIEKGSEMAYLLAWVVCVWGELHYPGSWALLLEVKQSSASDLSKSRAQSVRKRKSE